VTEYAYTSHVQLMLTMIAIIQTATNAARTTNETQVQKVPNGRPRAYGGPTDLFAKLDNARPMQREREKVLNKGIPKHSNLQFMSPRPRERGTTGKEGHRDT
jgi:hypothetical protein